LFHMPCGAAVCRLVSSWLIGVIAGGACRGEAHRALKARSARRDASHARIYPNGEIARPDPKTFSDHEGSGEGEGSAEVQRGGRAGREHCLSQCSRAHDTVLLLAINAVAATPEVSFDDVCIYMNVCVCVYVYVSAHCDKYMNVCVCVYV